MKKNKSFIKGALKFTVQEPQPHHKTISYSQFSLYMSCPLNWKLKYIDKIKEVSPNISLLFGTAMHETLQDYLHCLYEKSPGDADRMDLTGMLKSNMASEYNKIMEANGGEIFTDQEQMTEHLRDGIAILDFIRRRRTTYFNTKETELIAIEMPIYRQASSVNNFVHMNGFVDVILRDIIQNKYIIIDIKTSTAGWNKYQKKDKTKISQLIIYKKYFAEQIGVDINDVEVQYFIVKRKVPEESAYPVKRVTQLKPASGRVTVKRVSEQVDTFIKECFNPDGTYNMQKQYEARSGKGSKNCKYCIFLHKEDKCPKKNRIRN